MVSNGDTPNTPASMYSSKNAPSTSSREKPHTVCVRSFVPKEKKSASVAKERLQIILARERVGGESGKPDYLPALQKELMAVISKYVDINPNDIKVQLERQENLEVLEVKIELPDAARG